jgi:2',3'-cyclic-nucleotide 2'-phosphodiesterase (5'-nucleotidase family)
MLALTCRYLPFVAATILLAPAALRGIRPADAGCRPGASVSLRVAATTDVHGHIRGWDYYENRADPARGLSRAATIVDSIRSANRGRVVLVDAGDMLQGTPLADVAVRGSQSRRNPIVAAMNTMHYDAVAIGNHEFNHGVPYLDSAVAQAHFPLLAANVTRAGQPHAYKSFTIVDRAGVRIGIVGATTPGSDLWDSSNLAKARMHVGDVVPAVRAAVKQARDAGADVIVVVLHSGLDEPSSYDTVSTGVASENVAARVASEVPGIAALVYGHSHRENPGQMIGTTLVIQPKNWATSVTVVNLPMTCGASGTWTSAPASGSVIQSAKHPEEVRVVSAVRQAHRETVRYVNSVIGSTPDAWRADSARITATGITGFILDVERRAANAELASTAAFDLRSKLGPGPITVAQLAQLYPYDNTLRAVRISGAQLKQYIEFSSRYYTTRADRSLVVDPSVAGYNFDVVSGVDYTIDVSRPVGERVTTLTFRGRPVVATDSFTLALSNYRQAGGGGYAMLQGAPLVYDRQQDIRQLLIDEVQRRRTLRESDYDEHNWSFVKPGATH